MESIVYVLTIDQRASRRGDDRVGALIKRLRISAPSPLLAFERTVGDELQGVVADAATTVDATLMCARDGPWQIGIGVGAVRRPLPASTRAAAGSAFERARVAVVRAKSDPDGAAVEGAATQAARDAEAVIALLATIVRRRSPSAWQAVDLLAAGSTQAQAADKLRISQQAVSDHVQRSMWRHEQRLRPLAARLLEAAA